MDSRYRNGKRKVQVYIPTDVFDKFEQIALMRGSGMSELIVTWMRSIVDVSEPWDWKT